MTAAFGKPKMKKKKREKGKKKEENVLEFKFCSHFEEISLFSLVKCPFSIAHKVAFDEPQIFHFIIVFHLITLNL